MQQRRCHLFWRCRWTKMGKICQPNLLPNGVRCCHLRAIYGLFANLRPAVIFGPLADAASLKTERLKGGLDILIVRELTGGVYFGKNKVKSHHLERRSGSGRICR